jgi:hypothetical protein
MCVVYLHGIAHVGALRTIMQRDGVPADVTARFFAERFGSSSVGEEVDSSHNTDQVSWPMYIYVCGYICVIVCMPMYWESS